MTTRRKFLGHSATILGSIAFGMPRLARAQSGAAKKLILVTCNGGWDVSFHLDPKPSGLSTVDVPTGSLVTSGNLNYFNADACNNVVDNFFAAHNDVASIVRGISVRSISHDTCIRRMMTGSSSDTAPDIGVVTGHAHGSDLAAPYLTLGSVSFPGNLEGSSVRVGLTNQLALAHQYTTLSPDFADVFPNGTEQNLINAYLDNEAALLGASKGQYGKNQSKVQDYRDSVQRAQGLADNADALGQPFGISFTVAQQIENALAMLERNVAWSVTVSTGFVWDHHDPGAAPTGTYDGAQGLRNQDLWPALSYLADQLKTRDGSTAGSKMIDETVVVVMSEMTRTPLKNMQGGKDHWPHTSALVFGGGVNAGHAFGSTDNSLVSQPIDFASGSADTGGLILESSSFVAGLMQLVGVDPGAHLPLTPVFTAMIS